MKKIYVFLLLIGFQSHAQIASYTVEQDLVQENLIHLFLDYNFANDQLCWDWSHVRDSKDDTFVTVADQICRDLWKESLEDLARDSPVWVQRDRRTVQSGKSVVIHPCML